MQYNDAIQNESNKVNNTIKRNGIYQYQRRIPSDLVKIAAFGYKKNSTKPLEYFRYSLGTRDAREARRLVAFEDVESELKFERKRQELDLSQKDQFIRRIKTVDDKKRKFSSLSAVERRGLIFRHFIKLEIEAEKYRLKDVIKDKDGVEIYKDEVASNLKENHTYLKDEQWDSLLGSFLVNEGIELDAPDYSSEEFVSMYELLERATSESLWRSIYSLEDQPFKENDSYFKGLSAQTDMPQMNLTNIKTIHDLCSSFHATGMQSDLSKASRYKYRQTAEIIEEFFGKNTPLENIAIEEAQKFVAFLAIIPVNANKRYPDLPLKKASQIESKEENPDCLSPKSQDNLFINIKAIFNYAVEMDWIASSPFAKKHLRKMLPKVESKSPPAPTNDDLNALFSFDEYLKERDSKKIGEARFWTPLICLFHGLRLNEACQLLVTDIKQENDIHFIDIKEEDDNGHKVKQLKNLPSVRLVPIHAEIINMGFIEFVNEQRANGEEWLFSSLNRNIKGSRGASIGSWFGRLKKKAFQHIPAIRGAKGMHSLRHAFVRACRDAGVEQDLRKALGGWTADTSSESDYGDGYGMETLKNAIDKVHYKDVDLTLLSPKSFKAVRKRSRRKKS